MTLKDRLLDLTLRGDQTFTCETGIDLEQMFAKSFILNLKEANETARRLIYNDHYFYLYRSRPQLARPSKAPSGQAPLAAR